MRRKPLLPLQVAGVRFLTERRFAILADDMWLGRRYQTLAALSEVRGQALVIVGGVAGKNAWEAEIASTSGVQGDRGGTGIFPLAGRVRVTTTAEILRRKLSPRAAPSSGSVLVIDAPDLPALASGGRLRTKIARLADVFSRSDGAIWLLIEPGSMAPYRFCELLEAVGFMLRRRADTPSTKQRKHRNAR